MVIKQFHRKEILALISCEIVFMLFWLYALFNCYARDEGERALAVILSCILIQAGFIYFFAFELRAYIINDIGVTIKWMGLFDSEIKWTKVINISYETVKLRGIEHNSIILTKIPLKKIYVPFDENSYYSAVNYDWLQMRPRKAIAIYLDDLKPGQYEEFWSYVPERLKGGYRPQDEVTGAKDDC